LLLSFSKPSKLDAMWSVQYQGNRLEPVVLKMRTQIYESQRLGSGHTSRESGGSVSR
jgi:hypothetical protein